MTVLFTLNSNLILLIPMTSGSTIKIYKTLNSNLILLIQRSNVSAICSRLTLNSNLILLILVATAKENLRGAYFKFQSDSINTKA